MNADPYVLERWADPDRRDDALLRLLVRVHRQTDRIGHRVVTDALGEPERRTIEAMSHGVDRRGAAEILGVSVETVADRLKLAKRILGAKTTTQACCEAIRRGLIQ